MKRAALAVALAACGSRHEAPPAPTVELRRGGVVIDHLALPIDLWTLCGRGGVTAVRARGPGGFVEGDCARRGDLVLTARVVDGTPVAELTRGPSGTMVARANAITEIAIPSGRAPVAPAGLRIEIRGGATSELEPARVDALAPPDRPRDGAPIPDLLAAAGIDVTRVAHVTVRDGRGAQIEVAAAALATAALRRNRRGTLRFTRVVGGVEAERLPDVVAIEVELEP